MQEYCISIIIPVYNCEKYISRCLNSIQSQDFKEKYEIIIVDDGSTDNTVAECNAIIQCMKIPCKLIRQSNSGVSSARNTGIRMSEGKYLMFVDGDDALEPGALKLLYTKASEYHVDFSYGSFKKINGNGRLSWAYKTRNECRGIRQACDIISMVLEGKMLIRLGTFITLKSCILKYNIFFQEGCKYGEDIEFIIKCLSYISLVYGSGDFVYSYYENVGSVMDKVECERFEFVEALKRLETFLNQIQSKNCKLTDSLYSFFIPYGILFHIDELIIRKYPVKKIFNFLKSRHYDELLDNPASKRRYGYLARKARMWRNAPYFYCIRIYAFRRIKMLLKIIPIKKQANCIKI